MSEKLKYESKQIVVKKPDCNDYEQGWGERIAEDNEIIAEKFHCYRRVTCKNYNNLKCFEKKSYK